MSSKYDEKQIRSGSALRIEEKKKSSKYDEKRIRGGSAADPQNVVTSKKSFHPGVNVIHTICTY
jgi:hypothetical protein